MSTTQGASQPPNPMRQTTATMTTTVTGTESALVHLRVDYKQFMEFPEGEALHSDAISVGGQLWRIDLYPRGIRELHQHTSIFLRHLTKSKHHHYSSSMKAIFEPFFLRKNGKPSSKMTKSASVHENNARSNHNYFNHPADDLLGYPEFDQPYAMEGYVVDGHITFVCAIVVLNELGPLPVPPSDIRCHLAHMLDTQEMSDVSFVVDGHTFHAHRLVLAARSPVFKAQLFGSMIEATATSAPITLHEIAPATFRAMLRFIYTDALPGDGELHFQMLQDLLAAANRYALDRLKLLCARKLWDCVSSHTVATILACAETYGCLELKKKCIDFCGVEKRFNKIASTDGYALLELRFPLITAEIRDKIDTHRVHQEEEDSSSLCDSGSTSSEDEGANSEEEEDDDDYDDDDDDDDDGDDDDDDGDD